MGVVEIILIIVAFVCGALGGNAAGYAEAKRQCGTELRWQRDMYERELERWPEDGQG